MIAVLLRLLSRLLQLDVFKLLNLLPFLLGLWHRGVGLGRQAGVLLLKRRIRHQPAQIVRFPSGIRRATAATFTARTYLLHRHDIGSYLLLVGP